MHFRFNTSVRSVFGLMVLTFALGIAPVAVHGQERASRGGSWRHAVTISRCAARSRIDPSFRYTDYGFRLARLGTHICD